MVKSKKKSFVPFTTEVVARVTQKKAQEGVADKPPAAASKKPARPPRHQQSLETSESSAENLSHLSLQDPINFPDHKHGNLTFSPPLRGPEALPSNTPTWGSVVKGEVKPSPKNTRHNKPETQINTENVNKHNDHSKPDPTNHSEPLSTNPPVVKNVWNVLEPPQDSNWVRSAPPVSTPKPFGASLDPLTVNVPSEPLTVNVPSQSGATTDITVHTQHLPTQSTEVTIHTPVSATLNVDAPVFQPKSAQNIPEFVPQPVEIPVPAPENVEYYDDNATHSQGYSEPMYPPEVPIVQPEFYTHPVIPPSIMPFLPTPEIYQYTMSVPISNPAEVHHIPSEIPTYNMTDMQNSTTGWQTQSIYPEEQTLDPSRDRHRGVYPNQITNRPSYYNQRYDGRRNSGQPRYQNQGYPTTNVRRDSRDSEASDPSYNQRPRNSYVGQNDNSNYNKRNNPRPPRNDIRSDYHNRPSNNNHNKNRDQNQIRHNETEATGQHVPSDPIDDWDTPTVAGESAQNEEQTTTPVQNHQHTYAQSLHESQPENSFDRYTDQESSFDTSHNDSFNTSSANYRNDSKHENWRAKGNPKDPRVEKDKGRTRRDEGKGRASLDGWFGMNSDGSNKDEEFKNWKDHWEDYQKFTNVEEITADLFAMDKDYSLAHCVAEDMRMGSGIAVTFKRDFKKQDELLNQRAKQGGLAVLEHEGRFVYYLVTKKHSTGKPNYYTLWQSLQKMKKHMVENKVEKLAIPRIGCGLDRLEWITVKSMIQHLFEAVSTKITVCNFQQNEELSSQTSPPTPKQYNSCKTVVAAYPVSQIEAGTIIVFLSTETGHVSQEMQDLDKKFNFLKKFRESPKAQGELFIHEDFIKNYVLCGCIVRNSPKDLIDFVSLAKCAVAINKYNRQHNFQYVGFQNVVEKEYQEEDINTKIITILMNYLRKVDVYICDGAVDKREE